MARDFDWNLPLDLSRLREHLTVSDSNVSYIQFSAPSRLNIVGMVSGYRGLQTDPDFKEFFLDITQGYDEELRIAYQGISASESLKRLSYEYFRNSLKPYRDEFLGNSSFWYRHTCPWVHN